MVAPTSSNKINRSAINLLQFHTLYFSNKNIFRLRSSQRDVTHVKVKREKNVILKSIKAKTFNDFAGDSRSKCEPPS